MQAAGSVNTDTTIWGFVTDSGGFSGGFGLGINTGFKLNAFFSSGGFDPNGGFSDIGMAIGNEFSLSAGQSVTVSYAQAYGDNEDLCRHARREEAYLQSNREGTQEEEQKVGSAKER